MNNYLDKFNKTLIILDILFLVSIALIQIIIPSFFDNSNIGDFLEFIFIIDYVVIIIYATIKIILSIIRKNYKMLYIPIISLLLIIISTLLFFYEIKMSIVNFAS